MEIKTVVNCVSQRLLKQESSAPLAVFRIIFGLIMLLSILRFWVKGWIYDLYIAPKFFFKYSLFEWVTVPSDPGIYILFGLCGLCAVGIACGLFYKYSALGFFLSFTYIELLDKTNYLNHYYFISIVAFLLIFIPANTRFSLDVIFNRVKTASTVPAVYRKILMIQVGIVYFFAGLAKLNSDWLLQAQPMKIWLKAFGHWPVIGWMFDSSWLPYVFSWTGAIYDLTIPFLLLTLRIRPFAYMAVVSFHLLTAILFPIGMFPYIMIGATLIFFPPVFHNKILSLIGERKITDFSLILRNKMVSVFAIVLFLVFQISFPFRHLLYSGELLWHEQGYRFSWRVMLMEKTGVALFSVKNSEMSRAISVNNKEFLTANQEKMMATQPDMITQYAHYLKKQYEIRGIKDPAVKALVYVTLNGRQSRLFIDNNIDLAKEADTWKPKTWVLSLEDAITGL